MRVTPSARRLVDQAPRTRAVAWLAALSAVVALLVPARADAHQTSVVYVDLTVNGRVVDLAARIGAEDLGEPMGRSPLLPVTREQARHGAARAARYVAERVTVTNGGAACEAEPGATALRDRDGGFALALAVRYTCPRQVDDLGVRYELFFDLDPRHQAFAEVRAFGTTRELVFREASRTARVQGRPSLLAQFADYLELGVEHIFTGYDHIAFLIGLLLVAGALGPRRGARYALGIVTAFTVAHSITLITAALGWVRLPSRLVESAIALSILYVALDNVRAAEPRRRWLLTFAFGLVHGFGFASVLGDLGLPRHGLVLSLLAFNVGVELGQLLVVAAAFPLLLLAARARWGTRELAAAAAIALATFAVLARFGVPRATLAAVLFGGTLALALAGRALGYARGVRLGGSLVIAALAALWLAERVAGRVWFGGALG